jgi:glycosyltransferase involved in cell wall biosynthesis
MAEMASHKGLSDLICAFSMLADRKPEPHLYILGHGVDRLEFERQAAASPLSDRILFCGFVADPGAYLKSADIFVLASHREGFGLALAEARSSGCAIVASNVGGIPEVLDGGKAGILVPPHSPELLANALSDLLENPEKRELLRSKAASNLEWLSCQRTATETIAVYDEACGRPAGIPRAAGRRRGIAPLRRASSSAFLRAGRRGNWHRRTTPRRPARAS